jgi:hypothetical protein
VAFDKAAKHEWVGPATDLGDKDDPLSQALILECLEGSDEEYPPNRYSTMHDLMMTVAKDCEKFATHLAVRSLRWEPDEK